ncbi:conserved membrane hypothetical protein [Nitrolancea hollandica Lb]|uniref:Probable membrane transporter protein n=2 Tax=Nitrolancea hollandica TaxID=1206749 RepID=I4ELW8_9BACT|nr:conserved membrane hypothetical protein [Nitrolancea hollandica Lb]
MLPVMVVLGLALAAVVGLSLGLLGGGGSILTVPIFVYVLGMDAKPAIAMSLAVVGTTSLFGAVRHWRIGNIQPRLALMFGGIAMAGTYLGTHLAAFVSGTVQLVLFAVVMLGAAVLMLRNKQPAPAQSPESANSANQIGLVAASGIAVGILTGLVGVGGGFLIVPALVLFAKLPMKQAVGTSLVVIAMTAASGFVGYLGHVAIDWGMLVAFTLVAILATVAGTFLVRYISPYALRRSFAVLLLVMSVVILYQNSGAWLA